MDVRLFIIDIAEKLCLVATAGLVTVLLPPLRNRLLGLRGQSRDRVAVFILAFCLGMWGAKMGQEWLGLHVNLHTIGVMMAAVLGGWQLGLLTGACAGVFYSVRVEPEYGAIAVLSTIFAGVALGVLGSKYPKWIGWRTLLFAMSIEASRFALLSLGGALGLCPQLDLLRAGPAIALQCACVGIGVALFVSTAHVVLGREENAVALVKAQATADQLALSALRRRLEPHFLFNALNTLRAAIRVNPARARELVSDLSDLYRYILTHPDRATVRAEVDHAMAYLAVEQARLGDERLRFRANVDPALEAVEVPALLLQPLVENAVKHGVSAKTGNGEIEVLVRREGDTLVLLVRDRADGEDVGPPDPGTGTALATLRERLAREFDGQATLQLRPSEDGMDAVVQMPIRDEFE